MTSTFNKYSSLKTVQRATEMVFKVCVVGAGVLGASTAVKIQEDWPGIEVTIMADKFTPDTTSDGIAGLVMPYLMADTPKHLVNKWCRVTVDHIRHLLLTPEAEEIGIHLKSGYVLYDTVPEEPFWKDCVLNFRTLTTKEMHSLFPFEEVKYGWHFTTLMCQPVYYIPWLMKRFVSKKGKIVKQHLSSLSEISELYDVIVVCTGLGARDLLGDKSVFPIRGQIVEFDSIWTEFVTFINDRNQTNTYMLHGTKTLICGGTAQVGDWNEQCDPDDVQDIIDRCSKLIPSLTRAKVIGTWAGLRPGRSSIRLEREDLQMGNKTIKVVYNYGHGGCGLTLHWGCAEDAAKLVGQSLSELHSSKL